MDTKQIEIALTQLFEEDGHRLVFWNDPEQEFLSFMNGLPLFFLEGVKVLRLDRIGALEAKIRLEREDLTGKYLIYSPTEEPDYEQDWLLDIRLYGRPFRADRTTMIHQELGLANLSLREHLAARLKFLDNKERLQKLKNLVAARDTDSDVDRKMITVTVRAEMPEWFTILQTVFHAFTQGDEEKGSGPFCRNGPKGASHKRVLTPFPQRDGDPRQHLQQHRRPKEVGAPDAPGSAVRQEDTVPAGAPGC